MKNLSKPQLFKNILAVLVLFLVIKVLWFVVEVLWLPSNDIDQPTEKGDKALYYRVKLTPNEIAAPVVAVKPAEPIIPKESDINDIKLLALYNDSTATIVTVEYQSKAKVLSRGDVINGFMLRGAGNDYAIFSRKSKTYTLFLDKKKGKDKDKNSVSIVSTPPPVAKPKAKAKKGYGDVVDAGEYKIIDRSLLKHYATNMKDIYKNIGIAEMKDGEALKGFWITFVRKDSPFEKLGLKRDDVIKSFNGKEINSYNAAFSIFKNIQNIENATLVIQRGSEEMELEYEIK